MISRVSLKGVHAQLEPAELIRTPVPAEANPMMEELINPANGALWRGTPENLAEAILTCCRTDQLKRWGLQAKQNLNQLPRQIAWIN